MKEKYRVPGEVLLLMVLFVNSMGVEFMTKSGFGIQPFHLFHMFSAEYSHF